VEVTSTTANAADIARWINLNVRFLFLIYAMSFLLRGIQDFLRVLGKPPISSRAIDILTGA
jgi:hypothetical protein